MKLNILLSKSGTDGSIASIETDDGGDITLSGSRTTSSKKACMDAAKALRLAADRFEMLSTHSAPYNIVTHEEINKWKPK